MMRKARSTTPALRPAKGPAALATLLALAGCGPASGGDPEMWTPVSGDGGGAGTPDGTAGAGAGSGTGPTAGQPEVSFTFTTVSFNGEYAPDNVGAVWVEDAAGAFVKTLEVWGTKRLEYVEMWKTETGGNTVDAITGATRSSHGQHQLGWDLTGVDGAVVPDGLYHVYIEFTEHNGPGAWTIADLEKSAAPFDGAPPDTPYFVGQHLTFDPGQ